MSVPSRTIYLDYASTTPLDPRVREAMHAAMQSGVAGGMNPASQHHAGRAARQILESARDDIAEMLGARRQGMQADRLIFTSGGTEANNLALLGLAGPPPCRVLVSAIEHPSVLGPAEELEQQGVEVDRIRVGREGVLDLNHLHELLNRSPRPALASIMLGNNETGVLQPVAEAARLCREHGVMVHADAVQVVGKRPVIFEELGVDALTVAAHKLHGPVGIGALLLRHGVAIRPQLFGGFQQGGIRPGTEPLLLAIGFREALSVLLRTDADADIPARIAGLRDRLESQLRERLADLVINGGEAPRLPHISNLAFLGVDRQQLFLALDFAQVACSTGSACASGSSEPSPVLRAMGLSDDVISSSLRLSLGRFTTAAEVSEATERISYAVKTLRSRKTSRK